MNNYNVWNKWDRLKTVMLGDHYLPEFFDPIKNTKVRDSLKRITEETHEDLQYYESVLKDFGCTVIRPDIDHSKTIMDYTDVNGAVSGSQGVPRSPLQARDHQFVAGNTLFFTHMEQGVQQALNRYNKQNTAKLYEYKDIETHKKYRHMGEQKFRDTSSYINGSLGNYDDYLNDPDYFEKLDEKSKNSLLNFTMLGAKQIDAPCYTLVGRDIYVDNYGCELRDDQAELLLDNVANLRINKLNIGGHNDGCFHTLKPGAILSLQEIQIYHDTFPGWDVCFLPDQSWSKVQGFLKLKNQVGGKWWLPGEEDNNEFTNFVETWLQDWVGYVEETVFDVNVLVLDEHHVCVSQDDNEQVNEFLKKHKMEPVYVPWRHRYFWDGGLHCITLDLEREGSQEDYFPERGDTGVIDYGFD